MYADQQDTLHGREQINGHKDTRSPEFFKYK